MAIDVLSNENEHKQRQAQRVTEHDARQNCAIPTHSSRRQSSHYFDMQREMAVFFSHEAGKATIVCPLQQLEMRKVCI